MSEQAKIRLDLQVGKSEELVTLETRLKAVNAAGVESALALAKGEISQTEFAAKMKGTNAEARQLASAIGILARAQRDAANETEAALETMAQADREAAEAAAQVTSAQQAQLQSERGWVQAMGASARAAREKTAAGYGLADAEEHAAAGAQREADAARRVAEASRLAAADVYQLAAAEQAEASAANVAASATTAATNATKGLAAAKKDAANAARQAAAAQSTPTEHADVYAVNPGQDIAAQHRAQTRAAVEALAAERELTRAMNDLAVANAEVNAALGNDSEERRAAAAARELADAERDAAAAAQHESTILVGQAQSLDHVSDEMGRLVASFGRGEIGIHEYDFAVRQLDGSNAKLVNTSTTAEAAIAKGTRGTANYGLAALEASRGIEDMQYGIGGVINNIPTFTMLMGGTGGLAAAISLVSVGSYVLYKHWDDLTGLYQTQNPFPEVTGNLNELEGALKRNTKELDDLREKSSLSNTQLERANFLIAEQTRLEAEQEAARDVKKIKDTKGEQQRTQAEEFKTIVDKIGGNQALADVQKALSEKYPGRGAQADKSTAEALLRNALQGNAAARDETEQLFLGGYGKGTKFGTQMMGGPNVAALPGEPIHFNDATKKAMAAAVKRQDDRDKKEDKELIDALEKQGKENEGPALKENAAIKKANMTAVEKELDAIVKQEIKSGQASTKGEVKRINAGVGDKYQEEYERQLANNALIAAQGGPVAHSKAEEAKLQKSGVAFALPEDEAKKRLQAQMLAGLRRRGASPEAAQLATKQITEKGDIGLQKELGEAQGNNQQKLMQVANQHNITFAAMINRQQMQGQDIQALLSEAHQNRQHVTRTGSALTSGHR